MPLQADIDALMATLITPRVVYFPVRHHSPACAAAIRRWIREHRPRAVLVEGPDDFQPLLQHLLHEKCVPPVAIYTHYRLGGKSEHAQDERHAAYYPLAACSPEWVALREGHAVGAALHFIDLDYASQRGAEQSARNSAGALRIESLQTEHYFRHSAMLRETARRCGCRDHDELWDHLVEVHAGRRGVEQVVRDVATYCYLSRLDTPEDVMASDGTHAREAVMAQAVRRQLDEDDARPILVVTGGFHTVALPALVTHVPAQPARHIPAARHSCLARYTFAQLDSISGYAAGMPQPGFYHLLWEALTKDDPAPYDTVALRLLVDLGHTARGRDLSASVSVADEIAALEQARRLAQLRGHAGPAREDLWDAVRGCLVKGELAADGEAVLALARKLFTGEATGEVPPDAGVPPLVEDFRRNAGARKLPVEFGGARAVSLEIYKKEAHRHTSRFLHRLAFLGVPYAQRESGPDFLLGSDLRRIIEHWDCKWVPQTETALIERSAYGGSVEEAATGKLDEEAARLADEAADSASTGVALLIRACLMGLNGAAEALADKLGGWIGRDAAFLSVAKAFGQLMLLWQSREPLEAAGLKVLPGLLRTACTRASLLLEQAFTLPEEQAEAFVEGAMLLNSRLATATGDDNLDAALFWQSLTALFTHPGTPPMLRGAAAGLLHTAGQMESGSVMNALQGALLPAVNNSGRQVDFLTGLLRTARELAWREPALLQAVGDMLAGWSDDEFLQRLPHLRLAWSDLTPRETDRVASLVAEDLGVKSHDLRQSSPLGERDTLLLLKAWSRVEESLTEDGLESWLEPRIT